MTERRGADVYAWFWRAPLLIWQSLFFVVPLAFMFVMSFWLVRNYRMTPAFAFDSWVKICLLYTSPSPRD